MPNKKYKIKKGAVVQKVPEGIIIFDAEESKLYTFNETGALIFTLLKNGSTKSYVVEKLTKEYDISPEQASREVMSFMERLKTLEIVE